MVVVLAPLLLCGDGGDGAAVKAVDVAFVFYRFAPPQPGMVRSCFAWLPGYRETVERFDLLLSKLHFLHNRPCRGKCILGAVSHRTEDRVRCGVRRWPGMFSLRKGVEVKGGMEL